MHSETTATGNGRKSRGAALILAGCAIFLPLVALFSLEKLVLQHLPGTREWLGLESKKKPGASWL